MGRRSGLEGFVRAAARASAAAQREHTRQIRAQATQLRQLERHHRMAEAQHARDQKAAEKAAKQEYLENRQGEADDLNAEVEDRLAELSTLLLHTLSHDDCIDFNSLRLSATFEAFRTPKELQSGVAPTMRLVSKPSGLKKLIPGAGKRHAAAVDQAEREHNTALQAFKDAETVKQNKLKTLKADHETRKAAHQQDVARRNAEIDEFQSAYVAKDPESIVAYNEMVLTRSEYPVEGFPQEFRIGYNPDSLELIIEYELPEISVIPTEAQYKYVKTRDEIESKPRKPAEIKALYQDVIASITLRTLHEVFEADQADAIAVAVFNGMLDTLDPASGRQIRVPIVSVRAAKTDFLALVLDKVDKVACLKNLGAHVSSRPDELQAIKPIVDFNMVDKRFVDQGDALSMLESRPNLLDLTPSEFETLVSNLFGKMGLDTKLTRASRDGGVDAVAFDTRPVLGGKIVIQAKRYRDTVGVSAVRDLYGTMLNEGACKGILVCTSGYGPDAYNFSKDKPIELIDGGGLLYLLREHADISARIAV